MRSGSAARAGLIDPPINASTSSSSAFVPREFFAFFAIAESMMISELELDHMLVNFDIVAGSYLLLVSEF
jgi:hypothetical protein